MQAALRSVRVYHLAKVLLLLFIRYCLSQTLYGAYKVAQFLSLPVPTEILTNLERGETRIPKVRNLLKTFACVAATKTNKMRTSSLLSNSFPLFRMREPKVLWLSFLFC